MANIMYGGTKSEMERLLADAEKLTGTKYDIENLSDVYDAIHAVQEELGITGTTALEASETLSGSLASMKGAFSNFLGNLALGKDVTPSLKALAETTSTFLFKNLLPMVGNILKALPSAIVTFVKESIPYLIDAGKELISGISSGMTLNIPEFITKVGEVLNNFVEFIMVNLPKIIEMGKELLVNLAKGILDNLPQIINSAITVIVNLIGTIIKHLPDILAAGASLLIELVGGIIGRLPDIVKVGIDILGSLVSGIGQVMGSLFGLGSELMEGLLNKLKEWRDRFFEAGSNIVNAIADGIRGAIEKVKNAVGNVVQAVRDFLPFSPAKEGPLKDLNRLNFGGVISESINNAKRPVAKAMGELSRTMMGDYGIGANLDMSMPSTRVANRINHVVSGVVRVEGVNNKGELVATEEYIINKIIQDNRRMPNRASLVPY